MTVRNGPKRSESGPVRTVRKIPRRGISDQDPGPGFPDFQHWRGEIP